MTGIPVLSVMTWAPFVSALAIMFFAYRRPMVVRFISLAGTTVSLAASLWIYWAYDYDLAGFQFRKRSRSCPHWASPISSRWTASAS